jgi:methylated-DNA-[protein]-cysteine S-methyltransferase
MLAFATEIGTCAVAWSADGLTGVWLPPAPVARPAGAPAPPPPAPVRDAVAAIVALLAGERRDLASVVLDDAVVGDPFRRAVYAATRAVGPGATATYGEIARTIGAPGAARAVGAALGANPWPIVVPCHRILAADGALTGFSSPGGIATKRRMLEIERAPGFTQQALFG